MKSEEFKAFVRNKPELIKYVQNGEMTWQKFYEIYDLYGDDEKVWNKYILKDNNEGINRITDIVKNVNIDSIKEHRGTAQKAIDFVSDLTSKNPEKAIGDIIKGPTTPRPLNKFFED